MNIYDLINMKKDIFINGYSTLEESYDCIESSPEEEYLNTICENFDLSLENANLQLFHYGSEEYIYEVLEENEYWDITEEGVISAIGEGIKKIIEGILNLIKKIFSFIGNLVSKVLGIFDRGSSEMDKVDKTIEKYNETIKKIPEESNKKMSEKSDDILDKVSDEVKNKTDEILCKALDEIEKGAKDKLKKEEDLNNRKLEARKKQIELKRRMLEYKKKRKEEHDRLINMKNGAKWDGQMNPSERVKKERKKQAKIERAHEKRELYGHDMNAKFNPNLNGPQSLDSLYNHFGKDIKVKCAILKTPEQGVYGTYGEVFEYGVDRLLSYSKLDSKNAITHLEKMKQQVLKLAKIDSIDKLRQKMIQDANKAFVKNYEDNNPFDRETKVSEIPLQVIKWYAYNAEDLKGRIKGIDDNFKNDLKYAEEDFKKIEKKYCNDEYKNKYENAKKNDKGVNMVSPEDLKKLLTFARGIINDYTIFHKRYVMNVTRAYTTSIKICKILTKQLFVKNEN